MKKAAWIVGYFCLLAGAIKMSLELGYLEGSGLDYDINWTALRGGLGWPDGYDILGVGLFVMLVAFNPYRRKGKLRARIIDLWNRLAKRDRLVTPGVTIVETDVSFYKAPDRVPPSTFGALWYPPMDMKKKPDKRARRWWRKR